MASLQSLLSMNVSFPTPQPQQSTGNGTPSLRLARPLPHRLVLARRSSRSSGGSTQGTLPAADPEPVAESEYRCPPIAPP